MNMGFKDTCWQLFRETGEVGYYLLYTALKEDNSTIGSSES